MRSVARCEACRAFVQAEDRFCWSCGSEIKQAPAADQRAGTFGFAQGKQPTTEQKRPAGPSASLRVNSGTPALPRPAPVHSELDPETALVMRRAYLAQQRGQLDEAEGLLRGVLENAPDDVPALSMLANILRAKGDLIASVSVAQRVSEIATETNAPPGAVERAREDRARIEAQVVRELGNALAPHDNPLAIFHSDGPVWYRSRRLYGALTAIGLITLFLALVAVMRGHLTGYIWFGVSLLAAGWCYHDAESREQAELFWAPFVLCLGPFGLAIYLLATY